MVEIADPVVRQDDIEHVMSGTQLMAIIVRNSFTEPGIRFFTPGEFSQQLGYMSRPAGHKIRPHCHGVVAREVSLTQEVLFIRKGRLKVDFYTGEGDPVGSRELSTGDVILLASGGHGFEMLEDCEIFEVKQGPYLGDQDKILFS